MRTRLMERIQKRTTGKMAVLLILEVKSEICVGQKYLYLSKWRCYRWFKLLIHPGLQYGRFNPKILSHHRLGVRNFRFWNGIHLYFKSGSIWFLILFWTVYLINRSAAARLDPAHVRERTLWSLVDNKREIDDKRLGRKIITGLTLLR